MYIVQQCISYLHLKLLLIMKYHLKMVQMLQLHVRYGLLLNNLHLNHLYVVVCYKIECYTHNHNYYNCSYCNCCKLEYCNHNRSCYYDLLCLGSSYLAKCSGSYLVDRLCMNSYMKLDHLGYIHHYYSLLLEHHGLQKRK